MSKPITLDRLELLEKELGVKISIGSKICDFCQKTLPKEWKSFNCSICPTIYDMCDNCYSPARNICHLHSTMSEYKHDLGDDEKRELIDRFLSPQIKLYGETIDHRINGEVCAGCNSGQKCLKFKSEYTNLRDYFGPFRFPKNLDPETIIYMEYKCCGIIIGII